MLGWHVSIYRQTDEGASPGTLGSARRARVAVWQTGLGGLDWLDQLVKAGKAIDLGGNGYPSLYTSTAEYLIPRIVPGPPGAHNPWIYGESDIITDKWEGKTVVDQAIAAACRADEWLIVEAWDES